MLATLQHDCGEALRWAEKANRDADSHLFKLAEELREKGPFADTIGSNHEWKRAPFTTRILADMLKDVTREFFRLKMSVTLNSVTDDSGPQVVNMWLSVREKIHRLPMWVYAAAEATEAVAIGEILRAQEASNMPRANTALWHYLQEKIAWWQLWMNDRVGVASSVRGLLIPVSLIDSVILKKPWYRAFESAAIVSAWLVGVMSQAIIIDRYLNVTGPEESVPQSGTLVAEVQAASGAIFHEKTEEFTQKDVDRLKSLFPYIQEIVRGYILTAAVVTEKISGAGLFGKHFTAPVVNTRLYTAPVFPNTGELAVIPLGLCEPLPLKAGDSVWFLEPSRPNDCWSSCVHNALFVQPRLQREPIDDDSGTSRSTSSSSSCEEKVVADKDAADNAETDDDDAGDDDASDDDAARIVVEFLEDEAQWLREG